MPNGNLNQIEKCKLTIPTSTENVEIIMNNLPDIGDSKQAVYNNEAIIGRSTPLYTYSHSGDRTISMSIHFFTVSQDDIQNNLRSLRAIQSATYPRDANNSGGTGGAPFIPPPVCTVECGELLANQPLCVVLQNYNVKFPTDVAHDENTLLPYRFDVETTWTVVYTSSELPNQDRILTSGR